MLTAANKGAGQTIGFPDVCNTPVGPVTAPIPYPNIGMNAMAAPFSPNVRLSMVNALNIGSMIAMTTGDEGGVAHPTIKGPARFTMGNPIVYINMLPGINLTCPTTGNNMNNPLGAVLVPSVTNVFFTYRAEARGARPLDAEAVAALAMDGPADAGARMLEGGVGYVDAPPFSAAMPTRVARAIERLLCAGMERLVLDLRDNPGGDASASVRLAEDFLPRGSVLARRTDQDGDEIVYRARQDDPYRFPLLILVNGRTASAAELMAGCLQWHGRAALIGEPTYGKGAGRKVAATPSGFCEVDAATFALPGGEPIEGVGLAPDVAAPGGRGAPIERDPALRAALVVAAAMAANDGERGR